MTKYKILTVSPFFPPDIGGIASHVINLDINLSLQGHDISAIAPKRLGAKVPTSHMNFKVYRINSVYLPGWPYSTLRNFSIQMHVGLKIKAVIRNVKFDIIHTQGQHYPITWLAINLAHKYIIH